MTRSGIAAILISAWLAALGPAGAQAGGPEKAGPSRVQRVSEARLREAFNRYLCAHLRKPAADVVVSKFKVSGKNEVPAGPLSLQVFQRERGTLVGLVRLGAIMAVGGVPRGEVSMSGWVDVFEPAVCTARPIKRGETLEPQDLFLVRTNISRLQGQVMNELEQAVGLVAKHNLRENTCLKDWMVEKAPVLDKGDMVTILAQMAGLTVAVKGMALERGYPGETVKVQNIMSHKTIFARVIDGSKVMVEF
jgi:flagella basal body P-ring formation protein FlgA